MERSALRPSHTTFALTMIGIGILGLVQRDFTATWSGIPDGFPGRLAFAYLTNGLSLVTGLALLWPRTAPVAARTGGRSVAAAGGHERRERGARSDLACACTELASRDKLARL